MGFHFRKTWRPGPLRISITEKLRPTWGLRIGRYGYDPRSGRHSFDTPGLGWLRWGGKKRSSRRSAPSSGWSSLGLGGLLKGLLMFALLGALVIVVLSGWPG